MRKLSLEVKYIVNDRFTTIRILVSLVLEFKYFVVNLINFYWIFFVVGMVFDLGY